MLGDRAVEKWVKEVTDTSKRTKELEKCGVAVDAFTELMSAREAAGVQLGYAKLLAAVAAVSDDAAQATGAPQPAPPILPRIY